MLFSTFQYFGFFFLVLLLFYLAPRSLRKSLLLIASYAFYMSWNWKFAPLLLTLTAIDYLAAIWIEDTQGARRRLALIMSLVANLGLLGFFKYCNFLAANMATVLGAPERQWHFDIVLPLGISFHTFQSISYVVDVYRRQQQAVRRPLDYALYISFFPQLVAGPIVRAKQFFGDLYHWQAPAWEEIKRGSFLIVMGLVKKTALADNFAAVSDHYFRSVSSQPGAMAAWMGTFAFAMQIFFDFSGYTDMAIGFARLLGFHFPVNFRQPYLSISITDFWRRWHISLSSWLRDYLYIPLGGNQRGTWNTFRNLMITMLLGGLWHGANWNFVIWGAYHGVLLSTERLCRIADERKRPWSLFDFPRTAATFVLVCVGWVFFRAATFHDAIFVLTQGFGIPHGSWQIEPALMVLAAMGLVIAMCQERFQLLERFERAPVWAAAPALAILLFVGEMFGTDTSLPFVYFQF